MNTIKIDFSHKDIINHYRQLSHHDLSSHSFQSLYLWREQMGLSLLLGEGFFAVKTEMFGDNAWFFPCGEQKACLDFISSHINEPNFSLKYMRQEDVDLLKEAFPDKWEFIRDENSDEYLSDIEKYIALEGGKFAEIRRNIRKINRENEVKFTPLTNDNVADAMEIVNKWFCFKHNVDEHNLTDDDVPQLALSHMDELDISGIVMYLNDIPTAFFAGFPINDHIVDIAIGKSVKGCPRATVYYALKEYLESVKDKFSICNHEEDLGIPSIRQVKLSLCPTGKNILWEAKLK